MMRLTRLLTTQKASRPQEKQTSIAVAELRCYLEKSDCPRVDRALFQLSDFALRTVNHIQEIEAEFRAVRG